MWHGGVAEDDGLAEVVGRSYKLVAYPQQVIDLLFLQGNLFPKACMDEDIIIRFVPEEQGMEEAHMAVRYVDLSPPACFEVSVRCDGGVPAVEEIKVFVFAIAYIVEEHLLVISLEADNRAYLLLEVEDEIHDPSGVGTPVYIVPDKDEGVVVAVDVDLRNECLQLREAPVNVAYGEYLSHDILTIQTGRLQTPHS